MEIKTVYYKDELNDDFAGTDICTKKIDENYKFSIEKNFVWKTCAFILYYILVFPLVTLFNFTYYGERVKNKKVMKGYKKGGFYVYGNHTLSAGDAFTPSHITFPKKANILINPDAVSIPFVKSIVEMLGGVAIPNTVKGSMKFAKIIEEFSNKNKAIYVYPEAHIWPYCSFIRDFKEVSFSYPVKDCKPVFSATRVYKKRLLFKKPKCVVYVDGPFFADKNLTFKESRKKLRDEVYFTMTSRAKNSYEYVKYLKISD